MTTNPVPQRHRVLIVDDDPGMVHLLARTLLDLTQLHFAVRGDDALRKLGQHKPDLLVIDAELPDLNGYEVIARMRENPELAHTAVVMVTSHDDASHRQRALDAGVLDFFTKPIDRDLIRVRVQQILSGEAMEVIELDERPLPFRDKPTAVAAPAGPAFAVTEPLVHTPAAPASTAPPDGVPIDVHAITSELFERMSAILSQAETLREQKPDNAPANEIYPIQRIQEECAEVIQLLVTISGED
ncbi:MAG: response regulator [Hydrogenophaga sp.]|uniref:response regulator n=1 Tax=Hydrogenophaga sp. TaxID=1904254 RepID=UPI001E146BD3|nr:response regulator [Hydrogenophaga sp.]MBX3610015.1 response regulator [Hydrogenophaga sp.]